jgi:hypothetical protein
MPHGKKYKERKGLEKVAFPLHMHTHSDLPAVHAREPFLFDALPHDFRFQLPHFTL